ncbi:MAG: DUF1294 domain-containing protein [Bacteroidales bacterium]|jgi:uncharacterized membrane protein YsdA (DUF1294 family)|nr:DUF1294 domain-containing protein [Bacteroidales bacterium]MBR6279493.1 DUF1294 domain-containing protein [Bacteroidales bacterium]
MTYFILYLLTIGVVGIIFLCTDKYKATHEKWRIKEQTLHILEFLGGVFLMLPAMYIVRHKCRKVSYFWITYAALILWCAGIWYFYFQK